MSLTGILILIAVLVLSGTVLATAPANLASGQPYQITRELPDTRFEEAMVNYPDDGRKLTDGRRGGQGTTDPAWVGLQRGETYWISVDLGEVQTVNSISAGFLQNESQGIWFPDRIEFQLSVDGEGWGYAGEDFAPRNPWETGALVERMGLDGLNHQARYVRLVIHPHVWIFIDEIEVLGVPGVQPGAQLAPPVEDEEFHWDLPTPEENRGAHHMALLYTGHHKDYPTVGRHDLNDLLPYVGYVGEDMTIRDFMFNSFLFLPPVHGSSGGRTPDTGGQPYNMEDWVEFLDHVFLDRYNLHALNRAVGAAKNQLWEDDYRALVSIAIPYPSPRQNNFGVIDGERLNFNPLRNPDALAHRVKAVEWYIEETLRRWEAAGHEHLELLGFYWFQENVPYSYSPDERGIIQATSDLLSERDLHFLWIPFHQARGIREWSELGFDAALMQPGYFFADDSDPRRFAATEILARRYGLGVEMEFDARAVETGRPQFRQRLLEYLDAGLEYGWNRSFQAWYQASNGLYRVWTRDRELYDRIYQYIASGRE